MPNLNLNTFRIEIYNFYSPDKLRLFVSERKKEL